MRVLGNGGGRHKRKCKHIRTHDCEMKFEMDSDSPISLIVFLCLASNCVSTLPPLSLFLAVLCHRLGIPAASDLRSASHS